MPDSHKHACYLLEVTKSLKAQLHEKDSIRDELIRIKKLAAGEGIDEEMEYGPE